MSRALRTLAECVPFSRSPGRWIVVLVCYLDDSGKDPQNRCTTLAGYVARDTEWAAFERDVEPWFTEFGVKTLHAKDLHDTAGEFEGWSILKKQAFVSRICQARNPHAIKGISVGTVKDKYDMWRASSNKTITLTPYAFSFNAILDHLLRDTEVGRLAHTEGMRFVIELGHENNPDALRAFNDVRAKFDMANVLRDITFVGKDDCRAIQLADLWAFYSRRGHEKLLRASESGKESYEVDTMERLIVEGMTHWGFIPNSFGDPVISVSLP